MLSGLTRFVVADRSKMERYTKSFVGTITVVVHGRRNLLLVREVKPTQVSIVRSWHDKIDGPSTKGLQNVIVAVGVHHGVVGLGRAGAIANFCQFIFKRAQTRLERERHRFLNFHDMIGLLVALGGDASWV